MRKISEIDDMKDEILADVITNKSYEMVLELNFYLDYLDGYESIVDENLIRMMNDQYLYLQHKDFIEDWKQNGKRRFEKQYRKFCVDLCRKNNGNISNKKLVKIAKRNSTKNKFKRKLINKTNKKIEKLKKYFFDYFDDEKYFELEKKMIEMKKLKKDIEYDIRELNKKLNPSVFPNLQREVNTYKQSTANFKLFFMTHFHCLLKFLDRIDYKVSKLSAKGIENQGQINHKLSELYNEYNNCLDDYIEKKINPNECEKIIEKIRKEATIVNKEIEEIYHEKK